MTTNPLDLCTDGEVDAIVHGLATAALWADGIPANYSPDDDDAETGGLQYLRLGAEDLATLATYVRAFLAEVRPLDFDAFTDAAEADPAAEVQSDPLGYVGHTLYLAAAGHGVSFTDRALPEGIGARLDEVARRICGPLEHAGFYAEDDETATVDMLEPYAPPAVWTRDLCDPRAFLVENGPTAWVDVDTGSICYQSAEGAETEDALAPSALRAHGVPAWVVAALESAQVGIRGVPEPVDPDTLEGAEVYVVRDGEWTRGVLTDTRDDSGRRLVATGHLWANDDEISPA